MARALDEIVRELDASYNPQRQSIQQRLSALPGQAESEIKGLRAQQEDAFGDILAGAQNRGLGFSGIPLGEQAKYTSSQFLPAVARVRQSQNESKMSLQDALNNIGLEQNKFAQGIRQQEIDRDWQREQFERQLEESRRQAAAQQSAFGGLFGGGSSSGGGGSQGAQALKRSDGGFNFTNNAGQAISAAAYAQLKGIPFRSLLQDLANQGDQGARSALGFVGDDFGYDPNKVRDQGTASLYNSLVWGVKPDAAFQRQINSVPAQWRNNGGGNSSSLPGRWW